MSRSIFSPCRRPAREPAQGHRAPAAADLHPLSHLGPDGVPRRHDLRGTSDPKQQYEDILPRAGKLLQEAGCDWRNVVGISFFLHKDQDPEALLTGVAKTAPVSLDNAEVEFVEGYSRPGKLVEIEITARR